MRCPLNAISLGQLLKVVSTFIFICSVVDSGGASSEFGGSERLERKIGNLFRGAIWGETGKTAVLP